MKDFGLIYNFEQLRNKYIFNRRLLAIMPCSTTSEILGVFQSFHGPFSNYYTRESDIGAYCIKSDFCITDLSFNDQIQFAKDRQYFIDNTISMEIFYKQDQNKDLPKALAKYFLKAFKHKLIIYCYYIRVNDVPNSYKNCPQCTL